MQRRGDLQALTLAATARAAGCGTRLLVLNLIDGPATGKARADLSGPHWAALVCATLRRMPHQLHEIAGRSDTATARQLRRLTRALGDSARLCTCGAGMTKDDYAHQSYCCAMNCAQHSARDERLDYVLASIGPPVWWSATLESMALAPTWTELGAGSDNANDDDELYRSHTPRAYPGSG